MNCWRQFALMEILKRIRQEDPELWKKIMAYGLKAQCQASVVGKSAPREETTA